MKTGRRPQHPARRADLVERLGALGAATVHEAMAASG